jgi:hypothetical protein
VPPFEERDGRFSLVGFRLAVANVRAAVGGEGERVLAPFITRTNGDPVALAKVAHRSAGESSVQPFSAVASD